MNVEIIHIEGSPESVGRRGGGKGSEVRVAWWQAGRSPKAGTRNRDRSGGRDAALIYEADGSASKSRAVARVRNGVQWKLEKDEERGGGRGRGRAADLRMRSSPPLTCSNLAIWIGVRYFWGLRCFLAVCASEKLPLLFLLSSREWTSVVRCKNSVMEFYVVSEFFSTSS